MKTLKDANREIPPIASGIKLTGPFLAQQQPSPRDWEEISINTNKESSQHKDQKRHNLSTPPKKALLQKRSTQCCYIVFVVWALASICHASSTTRSDRSQSRMRGSSITSNWRYLTRCTQSTCLVGLNEISTTV
jgi:hypothetical protein